MTRPAAVFALLAVATNARADAAKPTFDADVAPVLKQHCAACHNNDKQRGGLNLATFAVTMQGGAGGAVVKPGEPDKSRLYTMTAHKEEPVMPPTGTKIPDAQIEVLRLWVEQGARENAGSAAAAPAKPKVDIALRTASRGRPEGPPPMPGRLPLDPPVHPRRAGAVTALAASPWAPLVAVAGPRQVVLYHADTGELLGVLPFEHGQVNSLAFSRNARLLLAAGGRGGASGKAVLYAVDTGAKVAEVGSAETDAILSADLSADQSLIAVGTSSRLVRVYQVSDGAVRHTVKKHTDWVTAVEFSPDGVLLATGDRAGGVFVWEAATAREFHALRGHTAGVTDVSWRADSDLLATASLDTTVRVWEVENGKEVKSWAAHGNGTEAVRFTPDGRLATAGRDNRAKLWDTDGKLHREFPPLADVGLRVAVSHDSARVAAGDWAGGVAVFAAADGKPVAALSPAPPPVAAQLKQAEQAVPAAQAQADQAKAAADQAQAQVKQKADAAAAAQAQADKLAGELAAAQKAVADRAAAVTTATPGPAAAKAEADRLAPAAAATLSKRQATEATAAAFAQAANQVREAAARATGNADLAAAAQSADAVARHYAADRDAAQRAHDAAAAAHQAAVQKQQAAEKALADAQAALAAAQKLAAELPAKVKQARDAVPPAKAAADAAAKAAGPANAALAAANRAVAAARARAERLTGAK